MTNLNFLSLPDAKAMPVGVSHDSQRVKIHDAGGRSLLIQRLINIGQSQASLEVWKTGSLEVEFRY